MIPHLVLAPIETPIELEMLAEAENPPRPLTPSIMPSLSNISSLHMFRVCFARRLNSLDLDFKIYDAKYGNIGYQQLGATMRLASDDSRELLPVEEGLQLPDRYIYLFPYAELPQRVLELVQMEFQTDLRSLLGQADQLGGNDDDDDNLVCVGRLETVHMHIDSSVMHQLELGQIVSGLNLFGEPTCITLGIEEITIVPDNAAAVQIASEPDLMVYFYLSATRFYVLDARSLLEQSELPLHLRRLRNVNLYNEAPAVVEPLPILISSDSEPLLAEIEIDMDMRIAQTFLDIVLDNSAHNTDNEEEEQDGLLTVTVD